MCLMSKLKSLIQNWPQALPFRKVLVKVSIRKLAAIIGKNYYRLPPFIVTMGPSCTEAVKQEHSEQTKQNFGRKAETKTGIPRKAEISAERKLRPKHYFRRKGPDYCLNKMRFFMIYWPK